METSEFKTLTKKVEFILNKYIAARNSDKFLFIAYLVHFNKSFQELPHETKEIFRRIIVDENPLESFKRIRAKFNQKGMYLGSEDIQKHRKRLNGEYRKMFKGGLF